MNRLFIFHTVFKHTVIKMVIIMEHVRLLFFMTAIIKLANHLIGLFILQTIRRYK
jgi:hypothetical protein